ncbi:MAG TPA: gamma-glutamylcyclotransferase family protein [Bryobacteraceae bacterium]|nr:gamma-glutamylcyclotransferase family protein [Bryobacteraceae bacterium]
MDYLELARALELADRRLAVYGTLAPGESNHWVLDGLEGTWTAGTVRGTLRPAGWAATHGFPGLIWNPEGERIAVKIFESRDLPRHWERIDAFEGDDYPRRLIPVERDGRLVIANIYPLR